MKKSFVKKLIALGLLFYFSSSVAVLAEEIKVPDNLQDMTVKEAYLKGYEDGKNSNSNSSIPDTVNEKPAILKKVEKAKIIPVGEAATWDEELTPVSMVFMKNDQIALEEKEGKDQILSVYVRAKSEKGGGLAGINSLNVMNYYLIKDNKPIVLFPIFYDGDNFGSLQPQWANYKISFKLNVDKDFKLDGTELFVIEQENKAIPFQMVIME